MQTTGAVVIQHGWDVYTTDGEHLGTVKSVSATHVVVEKGRIFKHDLFIPLTSFMEVDETEHRGTLAVRSDQLDSMGWDQPAGDASDATPTGDLPPDPDPGATDAGTLLRRHFTDKPGEGAIDDPEPAQPSLDTEPRAIDTP